MNRYLLEVGTEELPTSFLATALDELKQTVADRLRDLRLDVEAIEVMATPRRLALFLHGLPDHQPGSVNKLKGPMVKVAAGPDGQPTQAGLGFARKNGVDFSQLRQEEIQGETYVVFEQVVEGEATPALLGRLLPEIILGLSGSHFMRWGETTIRFSRPVRWLVSLWNDAPCPMEIGPVAAGVTTRGHRILAKESEFSITEIASYETRLRELGAVIVDPAKRKDAIREQLQAKAREVGGVAAIDEDLLDTVTMLVEAPTVIVGRFDDRFLPIPKEVATTVMAAHQKYFPVEREPGGELLPYFLAVSNGNPAAAETIRLGNERVLTARFEDAVFFFDEDRRRTLADRVPELEGITFQKGLGSLKEKTDRLIGLSEKVAAAMALNGEQTEQVKRAALLSKTDLMTSLVRELTELQGAVGRKYAYLDGEPAPVAEAIFGQYLPRFAGDNVATEPVSVALTLADKLDTLTAVFSQEKARIPTGSKDPLGLRRLAAGIIQTVIENRLSVDLMVLFEAAYDGLSVYTQSDRATTLERVATFLHQRLNGILLDRGLRYDVIDAVMGACEVLSDLPDALSRMEALKQLIEAGGERFSAIYEPANRIERILGAAYDAKAQLAAVSPERFAHPSEQGLFDAVRQVNPDQCLTSLVDALVPLAGPITAFFESVLVNDPDEAVKANRYVLLSSVSSLYRRVACFSKLVIASES
jgi:glycyl-tRNA synthetase beta chain